MRSELLTMILLILIGCGREEESNKQGASSPQLLSIALQSKDDLPECSRLNDTQMSYVIDIEQYFVCKEESWMEIDPPSNTKTAKGSKGEDGKDGTDGETVTTNNWYDSTTGKLWIIGAQVNVGLINTACSGNYRLPTKDEALGAAIRGLGVAASTINGPTTMWTSTPYVPSSGAGSQTFINAINTAPSDAESIIANSQSKGLFCVEK